MSHWLRWLREAGILICTISLLLLPWLHDPYPSNGISPVVMGTEFLDIRSPVIIGAFLCLWLAYLISRFASNKWSAAFPFFIGFLLYHWAYFSLTLVPDRSDPWGIPLGRVVSNPGDRTYDLLVGGWINLLGIFLLLIGVIQSQSNPNGRFFILTVSGAVLGWDLFWGLIYVFGDTLLVFLNIPEIVLWLNMVGFPVIGGIIAAYIARKYMRHPALPLSA